MAGYTSESFYDFLNDESLESSNKDSSNGSNHLASYFGEASQGAHPFFGCVMAQHVELLAKQRDNSLGQHMSIVKVGVTHSCNMIHALAKDRLRCQDKDSQKTPWHT